MPRSFTAVTIHTTAMSSRLAMAFEDYETYHQAPGNKLCHYLGIPLIAFSLVGLLSAVAIGRIGPWNIDLGILIACLVVGYGMLLSPRLAAVFGVVLALFYLLARPLPSVLLWCGFAAGWFLQFLGHFFYEKKSPAFFKNLQHLVTGPLWVVAQVVGYPATEQPDSLK